MQESIDCLELIGRITKIIQAGFKSNPGKFKVKSDVTGKTVHIICPFFCPVQEGDCIFALVVDANYTEKKGPKGRVNKYYKIIRPPFVQQPVDKNSILRCFINVIPGVGGIKAEELYDIFVSQTKDDKSVIDIISEAAVNWLLSNDSEILQIYRKAVAPQYMSRFFYWWHKYRSLRRLYLLGLTNKEIDACKLDCNKIYEACMTNPHKLYAIPMEKCEEILLRQNKSSTEVNRFCGAICRKIYDNLIHRAWTSTPLKALRATYPNIDSYVAYMIKEFNIYCQLDNLYLEYPYTVENYLAQKIQSMISTDDSSEEPDTLVIRQPVNYLSEKLTYEQKLAIAEALEKNICIITGGPGTGKTTIIGEICHNLEMRAIKYVVASFTGKAVSRIREVIKNKEASTMHRLIARARTIPLFAHLIIDEFSMMTMDLMYTFFKTFRFPYKITLVGDINQLEPISWGSIFSELIKSNTIATYVLTQNHRIMTTEGKKNGIFSNSEKILKVEDDDFLELEITDNFQLISGDISRVYDILGSLYSEGIAIDDIIIITPFNAVLKELNSKVQKIYNETNKYTIDKKENLWFLKDKVMMTRNNYYYNIMNGEIGTIVDLTETNIAVQFTDGAVHLFSTADEPVPSENNEQSKKYKNKWSANNDNKVDPLTGESKYDEKNLFTSMLIHAYALTTHKSQGNQWKYVIVYVPPNCRGGSFVNKNLLYTAVTRARKAVWIVGDLVAFRAAAYIHPIKRIDNLHKRLTNIKETDKQEKAIFEDI